MRRRWSLAEEEVILERDAGAAQVELGALDADRVLDMERVRAGRNRGAGAAQRPDGHPFREGDRDRVVLVEDHPQLQIGRARALHTTNESEHRHEERSDRRGEAPGRTGHGTDLRFLPSATRRSYTGEGPRLDFRSPTSEPVDAGHRARLRDDPRVAAKRGRGGVRLGADARRILLVQALRAFAYGLGSVLIGVTLADLGFSGVQVGLVLGALVGGTALVSVALARSGDRIGRRRWYVRLLVVMGVAGTVFALTGSVWLLVLVALTGTLSTEVVESGPFTSLEQAMLPDAAEGRDPTPLFGTYNTIATLAGSLGALAAIATRFVDVEPQRFLLAYPLVAAAATVVAMGLTSTVESRRTSQAAPPRPLERSRGIVRRLSGLFALDAFGGGFVTQAFLAYWFTEKWGTSTATLGVAFFAIGLLQAVSFQIAVRLAGRIGLLNTMVFSHLPSNLLLALIPFAPSQRTAIALLLARSVLSQMDVPTRQAYVVAVVDPDERVAAAAYTNTARYVVRPFGPLLAGPIITVSLGAPFVIAGALKSVYDLGLYALFRETKPPGE